ncbi:MAG: CocE/NonD family hydrolase [Deltaproteobacteria bacterium]|nr:MAG: CocE/NonD family hydrolase [Deltaproteobacteria bacterium]
MRIRPALVSWLIATVWIFTACDSSSGGGDDTVDAAIDVIADVVEDAALDTAQGDTRVPNPALEGTVPATFIVRPGVETVTVFDAPAGALLTLYDGAGDRVVTMTADAFGQCHFAYVPAEYEVVDFTTSIDTEVIRRGDVLKPGDGYVIRQDDEDPPLASPEFRVMAIDDVPDASLFEGQVLQGIHYGIFGLGEGEVPYDGFNYIETRDGVLLSAMVRFPDPAIWGEGPWPTVVEYSGYAPSNPDGPDAGSRIATLLGYATVGVNMRGTGCSGGVFDVFSPAQQADGYDVIETVARQPWVLNGKVGMVGISYPGITQLYVAATRPPHLAAITPVSVMADPWQLLWPGGIYNNGFTRQWLAERDRQAAPNGQSWTDGRIAWGDVDCEAHQQLRNQNIPFEEFFKALEFYPPAATERSLPLLVPKIEVPVYLSGAWQDEQTGPQFAEMLGDFTSAPLRRFTLYNGRHVDGFSPLALTRWWEFLELYVAQRLPRMPDFVRELAGPEISQTYDSENLTFEPDRFADLADGDYAGALTRYEAEPEVRVLFENGAGDDAQPAAPAARFEASWNAWPPPGAETRVFYLAPDGTLADEAPNDEHSERFMFDQDAGAVTFFPNNEYHQMRRLWDMEWTEYPAEHSLSYVSAPLEGDLVLAGPGWADLWVASDADALNLQVTISEVRSDGVEYLVQTGWLRVGHDGVDAEASGDHYVAYTFKERDFTPLTAGEYVETWVPINSVAHAFRAGSRLRVVIATPGRDKGLWEFINPDYGDTVPWQHVAFGGDRASNLHLTTVSGVDVAPGYPPCPSLRGQPCRTYTESTNAPSE